nr:MAG TPA: hypothetical protein [Caudoviricetes sp.]
MHREGSQRAFIRAESLTFHQHNFSFSQLTYRRH